MLCLGLWSRGGACVTGSILEGMSGMVCDDWAPYHVASADKAVCLQWKVLYLRRLRSGRLKGRMKVDNAEDMPCRH
jgi:hypothetical protein